MIRGGGQSTLFGTVLLTSALAIVSVGVAPAAAANKVIGHGVRLKGTTSSRERRRKLPSAAASSGLTYSNRPSGAASICSAAARRLPALLAALLATGLAGCGGPSDPLASVSTAVRTSLAHTFIAGVTLTGAEALGAKPKQELHAAGAFDVRRGLAYERVDIPGPLDQNKRPPRDFLVFLRTKIFLSPAAQLALPEGKSVISVPLTGPEAASAASTRFVAQAMGLNPVLLLDEIAAGGTAAAKTGSDVVAHVPFVDYRVTVNLRRALLRVRGPFARAERLAIRHELAALGPGRSVVQVAVRTDGAGFVRLLKATVPGSKLGTLALDLHGYGATFEPSYPPAAQVVPLASLIGSAAWTAHSPWTLAG